MHILVVHVDMCCKIYKINYFSDWTTDRKVGEGSSSWRQTKSTKRRSKRNRS